MTDFKAPWFWGKGWEQATGADGGLILGEDAEDECGANPIKYADLQLFAADGEPIIPIRIDHYEVLFDGDRIKPEYRRLIAAAPELLAACERCRKAMSSVGPRMRTELPAGNDYEAAMDAATGAIAKARGI